MKARFCVTNKSQRQVLAEPSTSNSDESGGGQDNGGDESSGSGDDPPSTSRKGDLRCGRGEDYWLRLMPEAKPEYSITEVKKAGNILRKPRHRTELRWAFSVFENWRNRHSVPLTQFHDSLQEYVRLASPLTLVAHRPKRIEAVANKLVRDPKAQLSTMQDIAGCRAIVKAIEDVEPFIEACKMMWSDHILHKVYPYIEKPNEKTGYRGVHLVYKYQSDNELFNNRLIEIQYALANSTRGPRQLKPLT